MYAISDAEYLKDFTMLLNDDIIDCFTEKAPPEEEIDVSEEIKEILSELDTGNICEIDDTDSHPQIK